jgi:hypothetical protein
VYVGVASQQLGIPRAELHGFTLKVVGGFVAGAVGIAYVVGYFRGGE